MKTNSQPISSIKYRTFSKAGITLVCPGTDCESTDTYQIGQFDHEKWAMHRGNYWCKDCRDKFHPIYLPTMSAKMLELRGEKSKDDLDTLMDMV